MRGFFLTSPLGTIRCSNTHVNLFPNALVRYAVRKQAPFRTTRCAHQSASPCSASHSFPPKSTRHDPNAWAEAAKALLPPPSVLNSLEERSLGTDNLISPLKLLAFLTHARKSHGVNVLSQLGVHHGQWSAVLWIARRILQLSRTDPIEPLHLGHLQLPIGGSNLDELTRFAIWIATSRQRTAGSMLASDSPLSNWIPLDARRVRKLSVGEVWRSLGSMILEAADESAQRSKDIMPHVLQIIAHLHHISALPSKIYSYTAPVEGTTPYRPPTLHFLSSRILTSLSDAVWRAHESRVAAEAAAVGARYTYLGHEVPGALYKVQVRELGPEIWMELVLWACVECGLVTEGASILQQLKMRSLPGSRWSTISWTGLQALHSTQDPQTPKLDWERVKARADSAVAGIEGYSLQPPFVELGSRRISTEVVMATIDGLVNSLNVTGPKDGLSSRQVLGMVVDMHTLLSRDGYSLDTGRLNRMVLRITDYLRLDLLLDPGLLLPITKIATMTSSPPDSSPDTANSASANLSSGVSRRPEALANVLYSLLHTYADSGDFRRANLVIRQLEGIDNRMKPSTTPSVDGKDEELNIDTEFERTENISTSQLSPLGPSALASYVDLVTQLGELESGKKLLYSPSTSQQLIMEDLYSDESLIPALVRFAGATSDTMLLEKLGDRITPPLSGEMLRAYLHCQVQLRRWDVLELLLGVLRGDTTASWDAELAFRLASFMMDKEQGVAEELPKESVEKALSKEVNTAKRILTELLRGDYGPPEAERLLPGKAQDNYIECIGRMIRDASEELASVWVPSDISRQYLRATENIPARAFNVLLQAVVQSQGSLAGARMWESWCQDLTTVAGGDGRDGLIGETEESDWDTIAEDERVYKLSSELKRVTWSEILRGNGISKAKSRPSSMALVAPNLASLQIILRRAVAEHTNIGRGELWKFVYQGANKRKDGSFRFRRASRPDRDPLSALIARCVDALRAFGYKGKEIRGELLRVERKSKTAPVR